MENFETESALDTAEEVLNGTLDILNGCQRLSGQLVCSDLTDDPSYRIFAGVASESNHLPIGHDRQHWNPEALRRKDVEIERFTAHYRADVLKACEEFIARHRGPTKSFSEFD